MVAGSAFVVAFLWFAGTTVHHITTPHASTTENPTKLRYGASKSGLLRPAKNLRKTSQIFVAFDTATCRPPDHHAVKNSTFSRC